jgi:hypothetical protein
MNTHSKSSTILASVMAMILAVPGGAWAGGGRYDKGGMTITSTKRRDITTTTQNHYNNYYGVVTTRVVIITRAGGTITPIIMGTSHAPDNPTTITTITTTTTSCGSACWAVASSVIPSAISIRAINLPSHHLPPTALGPV